MANFQPSEYILLAECLLQQYGKASEHVLLRDKGFTPQAIYRAAISRAYYGALISARNAAGIIFNPRSRDSHSEIIDYYNGRGGDDAAVGTALETMKKKRRHADYNTESGLCLKDADQVMQKALLVLEILRGDAV